LLDEKALLLFEILKLIFWAVPIQPIKTLHHDRQSGKIVPQFWPELLFFLLTAGIFTEGTCPHGQVDNDRGQEKKPQMNADKSRFESGSLGRQKSNSPFCRPMGFKFRNYF